MNEKIEQVLAERGSNYGKFSEQAKTSQLLKDIMKDTPGYKKASLSQRECLEMMAVKISRILHGDPYYDDSWRDISGYCTLIVQELGTGESQ